MTSELLLIFLDSALLHLKSSLKAKVYAIYIYVRMAAPAVTRDINKPYPHAVIMNDLFLFYYYSTQHND